MDEGCIFGDVVSALDEEFLEFGSVELRGGCVSMDCAGNHFVEFEGTAVPFFSVGFVEDIFPLVVHAPFGNDAVDGAFEFVFSHEWVFNVGEGDGVVDDKIEESAGESAEIEAEIGFEKRGVWVIKGSAVVLSLGVLVWEEKVAGDAFAVDFVDGAVKVDDFVDASVGGYFEYFVLVRNVVVEVCFFGLYIHDVSDV